MTQSREDRLKQKIVDRYLEESNQEASSLRNRPDFFPELDYFVTLLAEGTDPKVIRARVKKPVVALMCLQIPLEILHALELQPFKIFGGSYISSRLSAPRLPAIMCPMLRSALGTLEMIGDDPEAGFKGYITPTTCDWVVKFQEMMEVCEIKTDKAFHRMELPHLKDRPESQERWLEEIYTLKTFLLNLVGTKKLDRKALARSMGVYQKAWHVFSEMIDLKRTGQLPEIWFVVMANSFFYDDVEVWTKAIKDILPRFRERKVREKNQISIFLAGSPIFFPNLKMLHLLEEAKLDVAMDDLCSSERLFPGAVFYDDTSEYGLLKALGQRYHQGCLCPTFADNDRRINNIISPAHKSLYQGVVFHVLKGCHPFDLESLSLERRLRDEGLKFIKLETDYTSEDGGPILTRLEAYLGTLAA